MEEGGDFAGLAGFVAGLDIARLDAGTVEVARACLLYGLAVGVATLRAPTVGPAGAVSDLDDAPAGGATRLLDGRLRPAGDAAFANAVLLSGRVQGDSHPAGHLGGVVIPVALAVAEQRRLSGAAMFAALIGGYEVSLRIGRDNALDLSRRGFRTTPCYGVLGAAAVCARGIGLDAHGIATALGIAANLAGGLRESAAAGAEDSPLQAGFAARNGIGAALAVAGGITASAPTVLTGKAGFYRAFGGETEHDPAARLNEELGRVFEFMRVTTKPYPVVQFYRDVVRGMAELRAQAGGGVLVSASVGLTPFEAGIAGCASQGPFTSPAQTAVSVPFCAALGWRTGGASYDDLRRLDDGETIGLARRVLVRADAACKAYCPRIVVRLEDGRELAWQDDDGEAAYTMSWERACRATPALLAEMEIPEAAAARLIEACAVADRQADVSGVIAATRAAIVASPYAPRG